MSDDLPDLSDLPNRVLAPLWTTGLRWWLLFGLAAAATLLLFASVDDGGPRTHLLASRDLRNWSPMAALPDSYGSAGHFNTDYGSKHAHGLITRAWSK